MKTYVQPEVWVPAEFVERTETTSLRARLAALSRDARWTARRWSLKHIFYRLRLPARRRRWRLEDEAATQAFAKAGGARPTGGPAVAFGEFSAANGLGRAAAYDLEPLRQRHSSLREIDVAPLLRGQTRPPIDLGAGVENVYFLCQPDTYGKICAGLTPSSIAGAYRVGRWVWETSRFPQRWRFAERLVHEVWAPSEFCARVFRAALEAPVIVKPHAVKAPPLNRVDMRARLGVAPDAFMGLAVMDIVSCPERKNPWAHVRVWRQAFGADGDAVLVMKLRVGKRSRVVIDELKELIGGAANIKLVVDELSGDEIAALQRAADVYLSLHRSEGYGLNIHEALLIGKPVIATHWSANAEYGPRFPNYFAAPCRMVRYRDWLDHYPDGDFKWAEPDLATAERLLVGIRRGRA